MLKTAIIVTAYKTIISKFVFVSNVHFDREDRICFRFVGFSLLALSKKKKKRKILSGPHIRAIKYPQGHKDWSRLSGGADPKA